jgi:nucleotide-binding universal stress UspA family protein
MFKKILVPIDGSSTSNAALQQALSFAKEQGAEVRLFHVYDALVQTSSEGPIDLTAAVRREGEHIIAEAARKANQAGIQATTALAEAGGRRIATVIADEAKNWGADLIAMGTHGRRGFEHLFIGSVAEGVARRAAAPVLLIRSR